MLFLSILFSPRKTGYLNRRNKKKLHPVTDTVFLKLIKEAFLFLYKLPWRSCYDKITLPCFAALRTNFILSIPIGEDRDRGGGMSVKKINWLVSKTQYHFQTKLPVPVQPMIITNTIN
jgi:hypothetical protein